MRHPKPFAALSAAWTWGLLAALLLLTLGSTASASRALERLCWWVEITEKRPVWKGRNGWLFERGNLIESLYLTEPVRPYLERLAAALRSRGIVPVALVLPTRGTLHSAQMGDNPAFSGYDPEAARRDYRDFLATLREAGFLAPDLVEAARGQGAPFFFARDHHWSPAGARLSARQVAAALEEPLSELPKQRFVARPLAPEMQRGSLQERAEARCGVRLSEEEVAQFETVLASQGGSLGEALFAEAVPSVVLAGSSNSNRGEDKPDLNFSGFLREELGLEVLNAAFAGAGIYDSMSAYLRFDDYLAHKPTFIVWETLIWDWHNRPSLLAEHRQVIPSVYGACAPDASLLRGRADAGSRRSFTLLRNDAGLPLRGRDHFVYVEVEDWTLVNFSLVLTCEGAQREEIPFTHATWMPNPGRFFLELSDKEGTLERVSLSAQRAVTGAVTARVCRVPPRAR